MKDREQINELLTFDIDRLIEYSYHKFLLKKSSHLDFYQSSIIQPWLSAIENGKYKVWSSAEGKQEVVLLYEYLAWDTSYFDIPSYKIIAILYKTKNEKVINENLNNFLKYLGGNVHIDMEVPSNDLFTIASLGNCRFNLIETRLHYVKDLSSVDNQPPRSKVRHANKGDKENIKKVALEMRNPYDRVHADPFYSEQKADEYLLTFAGNCIDGFADFVLVPDDSDEPGGFLAANFPAEFLGYNVAKLVLAAIDSKKRKGWLKSLAIEMLFAQIALGGDYLTTITQPSNIGSVRAWEYLNFKLYGCTHIYSKHKL